MSTKADLVDPVKGNSPTLVRPRYSAGLLLRDDDLTAAVDYTRNLNRLLFRSLLGCGVICGLKVTVGTACGDKTVITIAEGVALAGSGDPIHVPKPVTVTLDPCSGKRIPDTIWLTLCLTDRSCAPRTSLCACDDDTGSVSTREIAGYEIHALDRMDSCACHCTKATASAPTKQGPPGVRGAAVAAAMAAVAAATTACADPCADCQRDHYAGICGCDCCDSDCVMLAVISAPASGSRDWTVDHSVRRFIRPVLMRDPQVVLDDPNAILCPPSLPPMPNFK